MNVVEKIKAMRTGVSNGMRDVPVDTITIEKTSIISKDDAMKIMKPKTDASDKK